MRASTNHGQGGGTAGTTGAGGTSCTGVPAARSASSSVRGGRWRRPLRRVAAALCALLAVTGIEIGLGGSALAEGSGQLGTGQRLREYNAADDNAIYIDVLAAGEWIAMSACGDRNAHRVRYQLFYHPPGADTTTSVGTVVDLDPNSGNTFLDRTGTQVGFECSNRTNNGNANVESADDRTFPIPATVDEPVRHETDAPGVYELRLSNIGVPDGATNPGGRTSELRRFDVTVMADGTTDPSPFAANGYRGRVFSRRWAMRSYSFGEVDATDANFYILTPGGEAGTNYVWELDFNNMAGFGYNVIANGVGVDDASSYSVPTAGNSVTQRYPLYLHDPVIAGGPPSTPPTVSNFRFRDKAGNDVAINPASGIAGETEGTFTFVTDIRSATYAIAIDTGGGNDPALSNGGPNGVYGDVGDVFLNGYVDDGTDNGDGTFSVSTDWDGRDVNGVALDPGNYTAEVMVRLGEFHFVAADIETSGGASNANTSPSYGLTVFEIEPSGSRRSTQVYWDDESVLNARTPLPAGAPEAPYLASTTPNGEPSGSTRGYHTWGNFPPQDNNWANQTFIDTFVYGRSRTTTTPAAITDDPNGTASGNATGYVSIDATTVGGPVDLLIGDADLDGAQDVAGTLSNGRGDSVNVTLQPDPNNAGVFLLTVPTRADGTPGPELPVQAGDTLTLTYIDANTGDGRRDVSIAATDVVGGSDGVPDVTTGIVGEPIALSVTDADLTGTTLNVTVVNERTGEVEAVTLQRTGATGPFTLDLPSTGDPAAGGNGDGTMVLASGDRVRIDYVDALRANGASDQTVSDTDTVRSGVRAVAAIDATKVGEPVIVRVTDGDRAGQGTIEAEVRNLDTGETEIVTLSERVGIAGQPDRPGVFEAELPTSYRAAGDASGDPAPASFAARDGVGPGSDESGDTFEIAYRDVARPNGTPEFVTARNAIDGGAAGEALIVADAYQVGEALELRVEDADLVGEPFVDVVVERRAQGSAVVIETQTVRLVPTGTPGEFARDLPTAYGAGPDGASDWNLTASANSINARATDVMTLRYADRRDEAGGPADRTDVATMTGGTDGTVEIVSLDGTTPRAPGEPVLVGESVRLAVDDPDPNGTGTPPAFVEVVVTTPEGESETVRLDRVGATSRYEGDMPTAYAPGPGAAGNPTTENGTLEVRGGQRLEVVYADGFDAQGSSTEHRPVALLDVTGGATARPAITATAVGAPLDLSLEDPDLAGAASVTVLVTRFDGANNPVETETVVLPAVAGEPGRFALPATDPGAVQTRFDAGADNSDTNGTMNAQAGDRFEISMTDALLDDGGLGPVAASDVMGGGADGAADIAADTYPVGEGLELSVTDTDLDGQASLDVVVERRAQGSATVIETQIVRLLSTGTPGEFARTLPTRFGTGADGAATWDDANPASNSINAVATDVMTLRYADALTGTGAAAERTDIATMTGGATGTIELAGEGPSGAVRAGDALTVTVRDADRPGTPDGTGALAFTVTIQNGRETETVTVRETAPGSGTYVGTLPTSFGTADDGAAGTMAINATDTITATYADGFTATGGTASPEATRPVGGGTDGVPTIAATVPGEPLDLSLTDADLAGLASIEVEVVRYVVGTEADRRTVTLPAVGTGGAFALPAGDPNAVATAYDASANGRGTATGNAFLARAGDRFEIVYADGLRADGSTGSAVDAATMGGGTPGTVAITAGLPGEPLRVTLEDTDRPGSEPMGERRTVTVTLLNTSQAAPRDAEQLVLRETAPGSARYEGTLPTSFGASAGPNAGADAGTMVVQARDVIEVAYADALVADGGPGADSATATVTGGTTGTISIAAGLPGEDATLTLDDADRPGTPRADGRHVLNVTVTGPGGETETVTLLESAALDGTYAGVVPTVYDANPSSPRASNDGSFAVRSGTPLTFAYDDALNDDGGTTTVTHTATVQGGTTGTVSIAATVPGEDAVLELTDPDLLGTGNATTTVTTPDGQSVAVTLTEEIDGAGNPTGRFTGAVPTAHGPTNPNPPAGTLRVERGTVLTATYNDALADDGGPATATDDATVRGGTSGTVTIAAGVPGEDATLELTDPDLLGAGTATVTVMTPDGQSVVTLTEELDGAGNPTGRFIGAVPTAYGPANPNPPAGTLRVERGTVLTATYSDDLADDGGPATAADNATVRGGSSGTVTISLSVPGEPARVTVVDADLQNGPDFAVTVVGPGGETETVTVTEDAANPGTFTGSITTTFDPNPAAPRSSGDGTFPVREGDVLTASYDDALTDEGGTATVTGETTVGGGATGTVTIEATVPGEPATITLVDADLSGNAIVTVTTPDGQSVTATLTEELDGAGNPTGRFTGTVPTAYGPANPNPPAGTLRVVRGTVLTARYADALTDAGGTGTATDDATVRGGTTGTVAIAATVPGELATLELTDPDLLGTGSATVTVTAPGGQSVTATLTEALDGAGAPTGRFAGSVATVYDDPANPNTPAGTLRVESGDVLRTLYRDDLADDGGPGAATDDATVRGGATGTVTIAAGVPGEDAPVTLTDPNLLGTGSATVAVTTPDGQSVTVTLTEELDGAGNPTGRFTGAVPTAYGPTNPNPPAGTLRVESGTVLTAIYDDALTDEGGTATTTDDATVQGGTTGTVAIAATVPGEPAALELTDPDLLGTGSTTTTVTTPDGQSVAVTLTEEIDGAGNPTGRFTGTVATIHPDRAGPGTPASTLRVENGTVLTATYRDDLADDGGPGATTDDATVRGGTSGTVTIAAGVPGDDVSVTLTDPDLTGTGSATTTVTTPDGQSVAVTLTEEIDGAGNPTGRFTGAVPTVYGPANPNPPAGTLRVERGTVLTATYSDDLADDGGPATSADDATVRGGDTGTVTLMASVPGEDAALTLVDADLAGAPAGMVTLDVTGPRGQSVTITLTEDPNSPGVFTAAVPTVHPDDPGAGAPGTLAVAAGETIAVAYADALTDEGGTGSDTDAATLRGGTAATVAIDATTVGAPVALTLRDPDLANEASVSVAVRNTATGETETVALTAVPGAPGTFSGGVQTVFGTAPGASTTDGTFTAASGDVFRVSYTDPLDADGGSAALTATDPISGGATGTASVAAPAVGDPVTLGVADPDLAGTGTLVVTVTNERTGETETVTLQEDPNAPGTFTATLPTAFGAGPGTDDDGTMLAEAGDPISFTYADALRADGSSGPAPARALIGGGTTGVVSLDPAPVGEPMPVSVVDPDLVGRAAITVTVTNPDTGGTETLTLTADPADPADPTRFVGTVPTVYGTVDDGDPLNGALPVAAGTVLTVAYDDALDDNGAPRTVPASAAPTGGADAAVTAGPATVGGPLPIVLVDPDLVGAGTVTVIVTNERTGETETVVLTEDPNAPGRFAGTLPTAFGPDAGTNGDGTMTGRGGDPLRVAYRDPFGADGGPLDLAVPVTLGSGVTATVDVTPTPVGTPTPITVLDPGATGPITVTVTTPDGTPVPVTLVEDPASPGTFTGEVATVPPGAAADPDTLVIEPGAPLIVTYDDPVSDSGGPVTVRRAVATPNGAPVAVADTASTAPETQVSIPVLVNDSDPEGRPLRIVDVTGPNGGPVAGGDVVFGADGTVLFTPSPGMTGTVELVYTVADPGGARATATITITIDADAPTAVADTASTPTGVPVVVPVLSNDTTPSGAPVELVSVSDVVGGTAVILPDGTVEFTPTPGFVGEAGFTYTVRGPTGLTDTARASVTVEADPVVLVGDVATTPYDTPVAVPLLANDDPGAHGPLTVTRVTQPATGTVTLDPDTGTATYDPDPGFSGTDTFTYEVCDARGRCETATVTITVEPPLASIAGLVWRDLDHDGALAITEPLLPGWGVHVERVDAAGVRVTLASTTTDGAGAYRIDGLEPGAGYRVVFTSPEGIVWDVIEDVTLEPGLTRSDQSLPVDPSGIVYDAVTREPVEGATLVLTDAGGAVLPGQCLVDPSQQGQRTGADGFYRFDVVPGAAAACPAQETTYRLALTRPDGTGGTSSVIVPEPGAFDPTGARRTPGGRVEIVPSDDAPRGAEATTHYLAFTIQPGDPDVVNNHLPIDIAARPAILVTKTALGRTVTTGGAVPYRITVQNADAAPRAGITVVDTLPAGFSYRDGSSTVDGVRVDARVRGRRVEYRGLTLPTNGQVTIGLVAVAGSAIREGDHVNRAHAVDETGTIVSNVATATVEHVPDPDFDCSTVIGRVFVDENGDGRLTPGEEGLPGVRLATVEGLLVTTGRHGRYHLPCAMVPNAAIGSSFAVKVDERTVPLGYRLAGRNPVLTRLTRGTMTKVNFAVTRLAEVRLDFSAAAFHPGTLRLLPDYERALDGLVDQLAGTPARLALVYHAAEGESGGTARMRGVAGSVERLWRARGRPYRLDIERTVLREDTVLSGDGAAPAGLRTGYGRGTATGGRLVTKG